MKIDLNQSLTQKVLLVILGGSGLITFLLSHRAVAYFIENTFYPEFFRGIHWLFWLLIAATYIIVVVGNLLLVKFFESQLLAEFQKGSKALPSLGPSSVRHGVIFFGFIFLMAMAEQPGSFPH